MECAREKCNPHFVLLVTHVARFGIPCRNSTSHEKASRWIPKLQPPSLSFEDTCVFPPFPKK